MEWKLLNLLIFNKWQELECKPVSVELTYGLERYMHVYTKKNNVFDLIWNNNGVKYKEVFFIKLKKNFQHIILNIANTENLFKIFDMVESESKALLEKKLALPAYDQCLKLVIFLISWMQEE